VKNEDTTPTERSLGVGCVTPVIASVPAVIAIVPAIVATVVAVVPAIIAFATITTVVTA
jgi:hypothetical protein